MNRVIYIVPTGADPLKYLEAATTAGAGEIVVGIPPALAGQVDKAALPLTYREQPPVLLAGPDSTADGTVDYGEVKTADPLVVTLPTGDVPAGRLAGYTPEAGHMVKLTRISGQWVVEDRVLLTT